MKKKLEEEEKNEKEEREEELKVKQAYLELGNRFPSPSSERLGS